MGSELEACHDAGGTTDDIGITLLDDDVDALLSLSSKAPLYLSHPVSLSLC
jgi:hypothetical protein